MLWTERQGFNEEVTHRIIFVYSWSYAASLLPKKKTITPIFLTIKDVNAHLVIYRWKVWARPGQGQGKKQGWGRQGWDKAEASRIEPKSPNVGQKHGARSGQNKTVL